MGSEADDGAGADASRGRLKTQGEKKLTKLMMVLAPMLESDQAMAPAPAPALWIFRRRCRRLRENCFSPKKGKEFNEIIYFLQFFKI